MDSFYDQPRNAPKPTNVNKLTGPLIPEVSLIQQPIANQRQTIRHQPPNVESYNVWKARNPPVDKENLQHCTYRQFSDPSSRKQVRFESPTLHRSNSSPPQTHTFNNSGMKALEEIYLANIPNRKLDLSVLDLPVNKKIEPKTTVEQDTNCFDVYNYKRTFDDVKKSPTKTYADYKKQITKDDVLYSRNLCDRLISSDQRHHYRDLPIALKKDDGEPTTRDLLKVIQQQNEQILLLQKQVACLLESKSHQKQIENPSYDPPTSPIDQEKYKKLKKGPLSKIAIDVMTSFEVSFRPQNQKLREINDSTKIEEIEEVPNNILDGIKKDVRFDDKDEVSLSLKEPLKVMERCPSPEESIHVDMQDYSSDEEDGDSDLGWTIYNNIMGQVNNIFKNAKDDQNDARDKTLKRVKEATMKHLKTIGVNFPLMEEHNPKKTDDSNASFAVKQLLMKYLPDEQLAKLTQPNENLIKKRPEFSFATIQYMRKYNLLASDEAPTKPQTKSPKILDVTALKQQPKLL